MNEADARRSGDLRIEARDTALEGAGEDVVATVRIEAQSATTREGATVTLPAGFRRARMCRRMKENGTVLSVGDFVAILATADDSPRPATIIHAKGRK